MRNVFRSIFITGVMALLAVLVTVGVASAQTTGLTNVKPNADYQNGNTEIVIDAEIDCQVADDVVVLKAVQNQGRYIGMGVLEVPCGGTVPVTIAGPFTILAYDGLKFRNGPFTLLVEVYDSTGAFVSGQGFKLKGK